MWNNTFTIYSKLSAAKFSWISHLNALLLLYEVITEHWLCQSWSEFHDTIGLTLNNKPWTIAWMSSVNGLKKHFRYCKPRLCIPLWTQPNRYRLRRKLSISTSVHTCFHSMFGFWLFCTQRWNAQCFCLNFPLNSLNLHIRAKLLA